MVHANLAQTSMITGTFEILSGCRFERAPSIRPFDCLYAGVPSRFIRLQPGVPNFSPIVVRPKLFSR